MPNSRGALTRYAWLGMSMTVQFGFRLYAPIVFA
jgi:hypothetical protein